MDSQKNSSVVKEANCGSWKEGSCQAAEVGQIMEEKVKSECKQKGCYQMQGQVSEALGTSSDHAQQGINTRFYKKYSKSHEKRNKDRIRLYVILKRGLHIFCYAILVKFVMACLKSKLNLFKVFKSSANIIKFAMTVGAISLNFLLCRWTAGKIRRLGFVRDFLKQRASLDSATEKLELVTAGILSSRPVMWLDAGDRNLVKLVLYMRGSEAFL